ncbi:toll/interleukin-1 receptor domain-containing protein [Candidatus Micrarchaeota archaeon]|nr:toll/interleukin-1 receptor domain-containing protein [Candidatus Micrarchaeota archaeon]
MSSIARDHLFISYAKEDAILARWLTLKLTNEGYLVWCDEFKQLGGESYPRDIDNAIKNQTYRLIALLSKSSINKPNPLKERTLAHSLSKTRNEDFIIPLNVDGLSPTELGWMDSDITYIPFSSGWARGLEQLLKKLKSLDAPCSHQNGRNITAKEYLHQGFIKNQAETLYANFIPFLKIPQYIKHFSIKKLFANEKNMLSEKWAFYTLDNENVISFSTPSTEISDIFTIKQTNYTDWKISPTTHGIPTNNIVSNLLLKSIYVLCYTKGLKRTERENRNRGGKSKVAFFPPGLLKDNKIRFMGYGNKNTFLHVFGERQKFISATEREIFRFHLSPTFQIRQTSTDEYIALMSIRLHMTDEQSQPLKTRAANARRKYICKNWWNHEWLNRYLAVLSFLADGKDRIVIGEDENEQIVLSTKFVEISSPLCIDEESVEKERQRFSAQQPSENEALDEDESQ